MKKIKLFLKMFSLIAACVSFSYGRDVSRDVEGRIFEERMEDAEMADLPDEIDMEDDLESEYEDGDEWYA